MIKEKVLVTGATSFVGSHCIKQLLDSGHLVRATVRSLANVKQVKPIRDLGANSGLLELVEADLNDADAWNSIVEGCTVVMHLGAPHPSVDKVDATVTVKTAVSGTKNVLRAAAASNTVRRFIHCSSVGAIVADQIGEDRVFDERDWTDTSSRKLDDFSRSIVLAEKSAWDFIRKNTGHPFELVVINPAFEIGPLIQTEYDGRGRQAQFVKMLLEGQVPYLLDSDIVCVDVRDVAAAFLAAMHSTTAVNCRHIVAYTPTYSVLEMAEDLAKEFRPQGYTVTTAKLPYWLLWLGSWFSQSAADGLAVYAKRTKLDNSRMKSALGVKSPINPKESLIEMAYSMIDNGIVRETPAYRSKKFPYFKAVH